MTRVYFVRHAQPEHDWEEDRIRPLTEEGKKDSAIVLGFLKDTSIQCLSPAKKYKLYKSSINKSLHFAQRSLSSSTRG